jgi:hypothetical protein
MLFIDIVGHSKLLIDGQSEAPQELNQMVRNTDAARTAETAGQLIFLPIGDGLATGTLGVFCKDELVGDPIGDDPRFAAVVGKMVVPETAPK